ncbi:MAG: sigma 54-interacting transcriptional regulator [Firmicutes bacterium]|nr:sigma 54-interacting transcriptional regulator [Bacillota bacterium]
MDLDPWMATPRCKDLSLLMAKRQANAKLIKASLPAINYVFALLLEGENVSLADKDGFIIEFKTGLDYYPFTLGCNFSERSVGTNPIGIALAEGRPVITRNFDHLAACYHSFSGASVPIKDDTGSIIGTLNGVSPNGKLSPDIVDLLVQASFLIKARLLTGDDSAVEKSKYFLNMIDCLTRPVIIFDAEGRVAAANTACQRLLGLEGPRPLKKLNVNDLIVDHHKTSDEFSLRVRDRVLACTAINKANVEIENEAPKSVLIFDFNQEKKRDVVNNSLEVNLYHDIVGSSSSWLKLVNEIKKVAPYKSTVLIEGESGTGKELVAEAIHKASGRTGPFIPINCGAIPKELLQSELFGYEAGAFTGARIGGHKGKFELADKGTVFLDEIGEMPIDMQVALLRFLEKTSITRIGSNKAIDIDTRVIAATNKVLLNQVKIGEFREDLYYRLNIINIHLPPLRQRKEDIPPLVNYFISEMCRKLDKNLLNCSEQSMRSLCRYDWPGNVRELKNVIERAVIFAKNDTIEIDSLPPHITDYLSGGSDHTNDDRRVNGAREVIIQTLEKYNGNITQSAKALCISRPTLYKKMKEMYIHVNIKLD